MAVWLFDSQEDIQTQREGTKKLSKKSKKDAYPVLVQDDSDIDSDNEFTDNSDKSDESQELSDTDESDKKRRPVRLYFHFLCCMGVSRVLLCSPPRPAAFS